MIEFNFYDIAGLYCVAGLVFVLLVLRANMNKEGDVVEDEQELLIMLCFVFFWPVAFLAIFNRCVVDIANYKIGCKK